MYGIDADFTISVIGGLQQEEDECDSAIQRQQNDDAYHKTQLDEFMKYYDILFGSLGHDVDSFQKTWWAVVSEILPLLPLVPDRDCQCCSQAYWFARSDSWIRERADLAAKADQERAEEHVEILRKLGYEDFEDFKDVITDHFEKSILGILRNDFRLMEKNKEVDK
ncbi:hypothetical protein CkaCkLH20_07917 [Colletotrichum karsti]|uniref:Uncharacterized protein n=1 Tax=Colletotrichum karsti TaxID=1095194 RepID=A0A9P6IA13_9PEZI|nr:uncharacterized protein CkaCkLH20_07917 [Colletotrichum karsti]KAF9874780.1 hypothetical protein CkaCkLH20_07917 [Colletotrichum karsti]